MLRKILKHIAALSPIPLTKNEYYDHLTAEVIKKVGQPDSICVDVGAHNGKVLQLMIRSCPTVMHYAFEPIPSLYHLLKRKYGSACHVYKTALSNTAGESEFTYVTTDPAYSGLKKRPFDKPEKFETILVQTECLDNIIPIDTVIALIKIDVEGGEYGVLQGAKRIIQQWKPTILFEFGKGGSDAYGITPKKMYSLLQSFGLHVSLLNRFIHNLEPLTLAEFQREYDKGKEFFFVAYA